MCGIVGMVVKHGGGLFQQTETSFLQMLYADALRGEDSTGIIGVERDSTFHIAKAASTAEYFTWQYSTDHKGMKESMFQKGKAYIGHNRKKTSGAVSDENAHPFVVEGDFALVHNGTLYNHQQLATNCDVDSEALAIHLREAFRVGDSMGQIKGALNDALGEVNGAYAVAMYDQTTHRVYMVRNKERPLALIETENAYYFMSEPLMGGWILNRNNYPYDKLKAEALKEHELIMIDMENPNFARLYREQLDPKKVSSSSSKQGQRWGGTSHLGPITQPGGKALKTKTQVTSGKGKPMEGAKQLKKFREKYLGARVSFWAEDYCERHIGKTVDGDGESEITLMAGLEDVEYWHTVLADVDLHKLGMRYSEDIEKNKWSGVVAAISVTKTGVIQMYVENAKPQIESKNILTLIHDWKKEPVKEDLVEAKKSFSGHLGKMTNDEFDTYYEEWKHRWATWQVAAANSQRSWRMSVQSVEQAAQICADNENGFVLKQEERNGHFVYVGAEGRVYYESAIVLH